MSELEVDVVIPERTENVYHVKPAVSTRNVFQDIIMPQNPGLAENNFYGAHQDSYSSESVGLAGPTAPVLKAIVQRNPYGFSAIMATNATGQLVTVSISLRGIFSLVTFDEDCNITTATTVGTEQMYTPGSTISFAGGYFFMDNHNNTCVSVENRLKYYPTANIEKKSEVYELTPIWLSEDIVELVTGSKEGNTLYSALPVWNSSQPYTYWCILAGKYDQSSKKLISTAYICVVQVQPGIPLRSHKSGRTAYATTKILAKMQCPTGWNNNTLSVSEKGAFFVTNDVDPTTGECDKGYLWAVAYEEVKPGQGQIIVRWKYSYENSGILKVGQTNIGSGTTPTITLTTDCKTLVSITDNASPQMNVVTVNDADGSLYSQVPVFPKMRSCDEASLIGVQDRLIVENNFGHTVSYIQSQLVTNEPGLALVQVPACQGASEIIWEDKRTVCLGMSQLARESGVIFAFTGDWGDTVSATKGAEYFVTAIDSWDGRVIWRIPVGRGRPYTHEYGGVYFNRMGNKIYVGTNRYLVSIQEVRTD